MVRFLSPHWLESLIDFDGVPLTDRPPLASVEKMHSFNVFKFKNENLRKLLMDFESQIFGESQDLKTGFGLLIQTLLKQNLKKSKTPPPKQSTPQSSSFKKPILNLNLFKLNSNNFLLKTAKNTRRILTREPVNSSQKFNSDSKTSNSNSMDSTESKIAHLNGSFSLGSSKKEDLQATENLKSLKSLVLGLKSFEYILNVIDLLENFENNFYSPDICANLQTFVLQCYYCEHLKTHKVFQKKIFEVCWSKLETPISGSKGHPYLKDIFNIIDQIVFDFEDPEIVNLGVKREEVQNFFLILFDFLLTLIVEIFSKIHKCSLEGRFQMKMDLQEILNYMEPHLTRELGDQLQDKFRSFIEVYWYNSQRGRLN